MKKHYIKLTVVITLLILAAFLLAGVFFTYVAASKTMQSHMNTAKAHAVRALPGFPDAVTEETVIQEMYDCWEMASYDATNGIGFYGMAELGDNKKLESGNFLSVLPSAGQELLSVRIIPGGDDFPLNDKRLYANVDQLEGMCDNNFVFSGTLTIPRYGNGKDLVYQIGSNELASETDTVPVSEWLGDSELRISNIRMTKTAYESGLNSQAKEILSKDDIQEGLRLWTNYEQEKLGTSCYISREYLPALSGYAYAVYVFHPLQLAVREHLFIYVLSAAVLAVLEMLVIFTMRKLYSNRMCYELMRQDLTRSIAHDLKTPLAVTKAYTENWEYIDEADRHEYAEKLNAEVDHMAALIGNMLSMSKMDSERELKLEEVELYTITAAVFEQMQPIIQERGLNAKLVTDVIDGTYYVYADPKMIRIVISNFITNAVKYAEKKVEIKLSGNEKLVKFQVINDGPGISKKDIKKIWEPFYKTDKVRTDRLSSNGMGLAINRSILTLHKAKYDCSSDENGTLFWFEIKRVQENE